MKATEVISAYHPISSSLLLRLLFLSLYFLPFQRYFNKYLWFIQPVFAGVSRFCGGVHCSVRLMAASRRSKGSYYTIPAELLVHRDGSL